MVSLAGSNKFDAVRLEASVRRKNIKIDSLPIAHGFLMVWDFSAVVTSGYAGAFILALLGSPHVLTFSFAGQAGSVMLFGALLAPLVLANRDLFAFERLGRAGPLVAATAMRTAVLIGLILAFTVLTRAGHALPRSWLITWSAAILLLATAGRLALARYFSKLERQGVLRERIGIVGLPAPSARLLESLRRASIRGLDVAFLFDPATMPLETLVQWSRQRQLDTVILAMPDDEVRQIIDITRALKALDLDILLCPHQLQADLPLKQGRDVAGMLMWALAHRPIRRSGWLLKQAEDKLIGLALLLSLLPLLLLIAVAIKLDSPGPVLFRQRRHGWNNTVFDVFKFRTMAAAPARSTAGAEQTVRGDCRVTRLGRILRKTSLDELPQLLNVLCGDMSLVGPRPHPVVMRTENRLGCEIVTEYAHRHRVKPGITGWAQVNGCRGSTLTAEQVRRRVEHDIAYIENWSVLLDLKILAMTPFKVIFDTGNAF